MSNHPPYSEVTLVLTDYRRCERCKRLRFQWPPLKPEDFVVVNRRTGTRHVGAEYGETGCGVDATGGDWWWPL